MVAGDFSGAEISEPACVEVAVTQSKHQFKHCLLEFLRARIDFPAEREFIFWADWLLACRDPMNGLSK